MNFSHNLKFCRLNSGLTQAELAKAIGISQGMIAQYELGTKIPTIIVADMLANKLGISCDELLHGKEEFKNGKDGKA